MKLAYGLFNAFKPDYFDLRRLGIQVESSNNLTPSHYFGRILHLSIRVLMMSKKITKISLAAFLMNLPWATVWSAGFSLYTEGSAVEIGNFAAGSAAEAVDASTGWYNPAGLVLLKQDQALLSGVGVFPDTKISGNSIYNTQDIPPYEQSFTRLFGSERAVVPAFHGTHRLGERAVFGLSIVSPFGLSTKWDSTSPVRYSATLTKLTTVNVAPELGALLTDHLSIGAGLDLQWADVNFNAIAGSPAALQYLEGLGSPVTPTYFDSSSLNHGTSFGVGFHAGVMSFFNDKHTRIGLNYQSGVSHQFWGKSTLKGRLASPTLTDPNAIYEVYDLYSNDVELPQIVTLSLYQDITSQWAVLASAVFSGWSILDTISLYHVAGFSVESSEQSPLNIVTPQNYRDAWRGALGVNYRVNDRWLLRVGGGYDQTPTVNAERDVRLPDVDRWAFSAGMHYQPFVSVGLDVGYTYLMGVGEPPIHKTLVFDELSSVTVNAKAMSHAQLVGVQAIWYFDQ